MSNDKPYKNSTRATSVIDPSKVAPEIIKLHEKLQEKFPDEYVPTSGFRAGDKSSKFSWHHEGKALDVRANPVVFNYLVNDPEGIELLATLELGIFDETDPKNMGGASGPHYHIGKDSANVTKAKARHEELKTYGQVKPIKSYKEANPLFDYNGFIKARDNVKGNKDYNFNNFTEGYLKDAYSFYEDEDGETVWSGAEDIYTGVTYTKQSEEYVPKEEVEKVDPIDEEELRKTIMADLKKEMEIERLQKEELSQVEEQARLEEEERLNQLEQVMTREKPVEVPQEETAQQQAPLTEIEMPEVEYKPLPSLFKFTTDEEENPAFPNGGEFRAGQGIVPTPSPQYMMAQQEFRKMQEFQKEKERIQQKGVENLPDKLTPEQKKKLQEQINREREATRLVTKVAPSETTNVQGRDLSTEANNRAAEHQQELNYRQHMVDAGGNEEKARALAIQRGLNAEKAKADYQTRQEEADKLETLMSPSGGLATGRAKETDEFWQSFLGAGLLNKGLKGAGSQLMKAMSKDVLLPGANLGNLATAYGAVYAPANIYGGAKDIAQGNYLDGTLQIGEGLLDTYIPGSRKLMTQGAKQLGKYIKPGSGVASSVDDVGRGFKSEIDWAKWNKEIPENKALMQEYNTIEATTKANGTWMKYADGSDFNGTPEQFIQMKHPNTQNFAGGVEEAEQMYKKPLYRGAHRHVVDFKNRDRNDYATFLTDSEKNAETYATSDGGIKKYFHPDVDKEVEVYGKFYPLEVDGKYQLSFPQNLPIIEGKANGNNWRFLDYDKKIDADGIKAENNRNNFKYNLGKKQYQYKYPENFDINKNYLSTDDYANYVKNNSIGIAKIENVKDQMGFVEGIPANTVYAIDAEKVPIKSLRYNNGMFDMTNPNIYKALFPAAIATGAATQEYRRGGTFNRRTN